MNIVYMQELQTSVSRKLNDNWNMYYHLPDDKNLMKLTTIGYLEGFITVRVLIKIY